VSEELFFRGWLWEGLRRRGQTMFMTACLTATPWLLLHGIDAPGRILVLLPTAVIISFARYYGGGVRASLAVHMTNNGAAVLMQTVSVLFGHGE
jgi:membrane protease YdiL (CAAX protease family)